MITKNKEGRFVLEFEDDISYDTTYSSTPAGNYKCTMELFEDGIEWDIPDLEDTIWIGLWFEDQTLTDYDGVFELPLQAVELLEHAGYTVSQEFKDG